MFTQTTTAIGRSCYRATRIRSSAVTCLAIPMQGFSRAFGTTLKPAASVAEAAAPVDHSFTPYVHTSMPGSRARAYAQQLDRVFDTRSLNMVVDYEKSIGNFIADADGNLLLDCFAQIASIPLGYNNPRLIEAAQTPAMIRALVNRPALGNFPSVEWLEILEGGILKAAPKGMNQVFTGMSGSDANEAAYKAACMWRAQLDRGGPDVEFTQNEIDSAMVNSAPGSPNYSILSFKGGFHGRLFGSLSTTRSKPIHKLDIPAFDWPCAPFPRLKYPLESHAVHNAAEEARCLQATEELIKSYHNPVAAVIVEPIQSEGGDNHASLSFFQGLRDITLRNNVIFIVDEVQTGVGATGKFWAHDHWNLATPPDIVTFSKKAQAAGYYFRDAALRPNKAYRQFNTWMGDPARALMFRTIVDEIERLDLVRKTAEVGDYLFGSLQSLASRYPDEIVNLRGKDRGTFLAFDSPRRDAIVKGAKAKGVNIGGSGEKAIRLRPMLIFEKTHADMLLHTLETLFTS